MHDWELIAKRDPFFGVVSTEAFRIGRMDEQARSQFYLTGEADIQQLMDWFDADLGARPSGGRALDIGCGVGRLTRAIAGHVREAAGYDVSETMVALARETAPANAVFSTALPAGPFDWINSYIVFQHIPPKEGLALLERCLSAAAPGAFVSLHFTGWRDGARPGRNPLARLSQWMQHSDSRRDGRPAETLIHMHDYNFSKVFRLLAAHGFERVVFRHTDHVGHHGGWLLARQAKR
jgi:SAM-dependent methyltransferase